MYKRKRLAIVSLTILSAMSIGLASPVLAKNKAVEFLKYFNPIPEDSYTNESQDRIIKRRKFKFVEVPGASTIINGAMGYFAIINLEQIKDKDLINKYLDRDDINGISVLLPWQHLEPTEFKYDWSELDYLLGLAKDKNKKVIVRISTCGLDNSLKSDTPEWVFSAGAKSMEFFGVDGEKHLMPIFWDSTYLAKWSNFINALGDKYDKNKSIHSIGITGGGILGSTRVVPNFVTLTKVKDGDSDKEPAKDNDKDKDKDQPEGTVDTKAEEEKIDSSAKVDTEEDNAKEEEADQEEVTEDKQPAADSTAKSESSDSSTTETSSDPNTEESDDEVVTVEKSDTEATAEKSSNSKEEEKKLSSPDKESKKVEEDSSDEAANDKADSGEEDEAADKTAKGAEDEDSDDEVYEVESEPSKKNYAQLAKKLRKEFGMSERQLVEHWKYVADIFPNAFKETRLNFDANPPIKGGKGQSGLDEISDYLIYRYGQRIYLTRQNVANSKHGFNEYRVLLKFHYDTTTGYMLSPDFNIKNMEKLTKIALEDGISYAELPLNLIDSKDEAVKTALSTIYSHLGYQLISREVVIPKDAKVGDPLKTSFTFVNLGSATALNPKRELDKDTATSYKIQLEFRNSKGKPIVRSLHTPDIPTNEWNAGKPIIWEEELKMPEIKPGKYSVFMSLIDTDSKQKLKFQNEIKEGEVKSGYDMPVGSVELIQ